MDNEVDDTKDVHRLDAQLLSDLWIFRAAARFGSITAASRRLNVTQGAVSQRVLRLEARLGKPLFVRQKGGMSLTESGTALMQAMTEVAAILNLTLSSIERQKRGSIVISCLPSLAMEWLVPHLRDFYQVHPDIEVFVRSELLPVSAERLEDDGIDIAIDYSPTPPAGLHELAALQEMIFPVCSPSYRERGGGADIAGDGLTQEGEALVLLHDDVPWIGGNAGDEWNAWRKAVGTQTAAREFVHRHFNLAHLAYHAAMCDRGVAVGRAVVVNRLLLRGELIEASNLAPVQGPTYRLLTHRPGDPRSPVRRFASWWAQAMQETQRETLDFLSRDLASV